jgi:hypothetical protein
MEISQTSMTTTTQPAGLPVIRNGNDMYDAIMRGIEPELTSDQIPLLAEKCKSETDEQKKVRAERYTKAFAEYDIRAAAFFSEVTAQVGVLKRKAFASAEEKHRGEEQTKMQQLESLIAS